MDIGRRFVREQGTRTVPEYRRRVYRLAATYVGIDVVAIAAIVVIVINGKFFVTLSQRSNVETLTLAFIILLFGYLGILSFAGSIGAFRILYYNLPAWLGRDRSAVERRKQAALGSETKPSKPVFLNCLVCLDGQGDQAITVPLQDEAGSLGVIVIDGAKMIRWHSPAGSSSVYAFFEQRIEALVKQRDPEANVQIVQWGPVDDEQARQYESLVTFTRNLARHLQSGPLWPAVKLTEEDVQTLTLDGTALCPILRNEAHLPDLEFKAQQQLPIIPEPLGFVSLSRSEPRADPAASMGCAFIVAVVILVIVVVFVAFPPWVPSV